MNTEGRFWLSIWGIFGVCFMVALGLIYQYNVFQKNVNKEKYDKCIESGGSWVPSFRADALCLRK